MFIGGGYIVDMETWPMKWSVINFLESLQCTTVTTVRDISIHSSAVQCSAVQYSVVQYSVVQSCIICELFMVPGKVVSVTSYWFIWPLWYLHYTKLYLLYSTITISVTVC